MNNRPVYINNGTFRIYGKDYRMDTYYPLGEQRPEYKIFHVWHRQGESFTFASETGFLDWLDAQQTGQIPLF